MPVIPTQPVQLQTTIQAPPNTTRVSVHLADSSDLGRGPLGEVLLNPPSPEDMRTSIQETFAEEKSGRILFTLLLILKERFATMARNGFRARKI